MSIIANISKKRVSQCARGELIRIGGSYGSVLGFYLSEAEGFDGAIDFINLASNAPTFPVFCRCSIPDPGDCASYGTKWALELIEGDYSWVHNPAHSKTLGAVRIDDGQIDLIVSDIRRADFALRYDLHDFQPSRVQLERGIPVAKWRLWANSADRGHFRKEPVLEFDASGRP